MYDGSCHIGCNNVSEKVDFLVWNIKLIENFLKYIADIFSSVQYWHWGCSKNCSFYFHIIVDSRQCGSQKELSWPAVHPSLVKYIWLASFYVASCFSFNFTKYILDNVVFDVFSQGSLIIRTDLVHQPSKINVFNYGKRLYIHSNHLSYVHVNSFIFAVICIANVS